MQSSKIIGLVFFLGTLSINATEATPVNINTADAQTIADALTNIGIKKAEAIIAYRTKVGGFKTIEELGEVSGIGTKTIEMNKADILLADPASTVATPANESSAKKK